MNRNQQLISFSVRNQLQGSNEHLEMLNGLLSQLLIVKWDTFVKGHFYAWLRWFFLVILVSSIAYITRLGINPTLIEFNRNNDAKNIINLRNLSELFLVLNSVHYLTKTTYRLARKLNFKSILKSLAQAPELLMFSVTCLLILLCIPMRLLGFKSMENLLASLVMFSLPLKFLFFCRASKSVGSFIVMIYKILVNDVLCFVVFLIIFVAGFSQSFLIIFQTHKQQQQQHVVSTVTGEALNNNSTTSGLLYDSTIDNNTNTNNQQVDKNYFVNLFDGLISMHMMAFNEFTSVFDEFDSTDYPRLARCLFCIYMVLVSILLINMLIAMLGKTYQDIASQPNESLRQWARALLIVERMLSSKERLCMLNHYSHQEIKQKQQQQQQRQPPVRSSVIQPIPLQLGQPVDARHVSWSDGETNNNRFYNSTWALSRVDLEEIAKLKRLKDDNKMNATRLAIRQQKSAASVGC